MLPKRDFKYIKTDPETPKTQLVIVIGLLVIAAIFDNEYIAYASLIIGLISLIIPVAGFGIVWGWYKIAEILSRIVNPIVLGLLLYFLFIIVFTNFNFEHTTFLSTDLLILHCFS